MIVKVNRVKTKDEIQRLLAEGVDIIGISLKLTDKNLDSRALRINEIQAIMREISIPNLSLNLNINEYRKEDLTKVGKTLNPNSLNLFIEANSLRNINALNEKHLEIIKTINHTELNVIAFGNGFGYDGPSSIPDSLKVYNNLEFEEVNIDTLGSEARHRIKSKKEWVKYLNVAKIKQDKLGDTILESITESMQNRPFLVDDRNIDTVTIEKLNKIGAKGITMSISNINDNESSMNIPKENYIASLFDFENVIKITRRIKKYGT